jgi:hypothetical protein
MSEAELNLLTALVGAGTTGLLAVLTPQAAESVRERLAHARASLPPAGKVQGEIEALIAAHPRISVSHAITLQHVAGLDVLTREERQHMSELAAALSVGFTKADTLPPEEQR